MALLPFIPRRIPGHRFQTTRGRRAEGVSSLTATIFSLVACWSSGAAAEAFEVTITNTSAYTWERGVLATEPLIEVGPSPTVGDTSYATYAYVDDACYVRDPACRAAACEDGNPAVLITRLGLSQGVTGYFVNSLGPGASQTVQFEATSPQRVYYVAGVSASGAGADDFVAMHVPG